MAWIDSKLEEIVRRNFHDRTIIGHHKAKSWQKSRYIQLETSLKGDMDIHYELYQGHVELHLEGKYHKSEYREFCRLLRRKTINRPDVEWTDWQEYRNHRSRLLMPTDTDYNVIVAFKSIIQIYDRLIVQALDELKASKQETFAFSDRLCFNEGSLEEDDVCLDICCLGTVFANKLVIPAYQRNYCWGEKEVSSLWRTLTEMKEPHVYHLGIIILQKIGNKEYAVIDGQQRLVTLTLICKYLQYDGNLPLLTQTFHSKESKEQIGRNIYFIEKQVDGCKDSRLLKKILNNLSLSVLILKEGRLELAYTFFSNVNSNAVALSDLDLLKAHHLRYLENDAQTEEIVERWNSTRQDENEILEETFSKHLLRLRTWLRGECIEDSKLTHPTLEEYVAASEIEGISPGKLDPEAYSRMRCGDYFFSYVSKFIDEYKEFSSTPEISQLQQILSGETHGRYASVIVSLSFAYYLKFGRDYLAEAMFAIIGVISEHRYTKTADRVGIERKALSSGILLIILQSPAPSFFIAECLKRVRIHPLDLDVLKGIQLRYFNRLQNLLSRLMTNFKAPLLLKIFCDEYNI